jgi:hypothetical protein
MDDHGNDWPTYLRVLQRVFRRDFVEQPLPSFRGTRMALKKHPFVDGMEATFWHMISEGGEGGTETDRLPDFRRCERIAWPRPIIEAVDTDRVKSWPTVRRSEARVMLALGDFSYVVVVALRNGYALPWTAFPVVHEHQRRKYRKEYERFAATSHEKG